MVIAPQFGGAGTFDAGLAPVLVGDDTKGKWGYIDRGGAIVISPQFGLAKSFSGRLAAVRVGRESTDKWGYIDRQGTMVIKPRFFFAGSFSDGLAEVSESSGWAYIKEQGMVQPPTGQANSFIGVAAVTDVQVSRWGYINDKGKVVLPLKFGQAGPFTDGLAPVRIVHGSCGLERWGYISR